MTTTLDTKLISKVKTLVEKYGTNAVFTANAGDYDPTTGTVDSDTATHTAKVTPPQQYKQHLIDGDVIRIGDAQVYLPAQDLTFTPAIGIMVSVAGSSWQIMNVNPIYTGDNVALYELQLRK